MNSKEGKKGPGEIVDSTTKAEKKYTKTGRKRKEQKMNEQSNSPENWSRLNSKPK